MTRTLAAIIGICALSSTVWAQAALPIAVDQRVRVWTASSTAVTGRVASVNADGFEVAEDGRAPIRIARSAVHRIEVSRGMTSNGAGAKKGALWGAIISGAIGAALLPLQREEVGEHGSSVGKSVALGAWSGGLFGGLIGAGVGAARAGEHWETIYP
jgi:hypothetical protein